MLEFISVSVGIEEKKIVRDVSLSLGAGSLAVLMGPNGSGKSTFINGVFGHPHYQLLSGSIMLDEENVTHESVAYKAKKGLFLSLQHIPKIGGITLATFLHKVYCNMNNTHDSILDFYLTLRTIAETCGIPPDLLDRPLTAGLSGGEKKLSEVLQLAILKPKYAILDEIDSGVDVDALRLVCNVVKTLREEGTGFLVVSHHPSILEHFSPEKVHVMSRGSLVCSGERALGEEILTHGFCKVISCTHKPVCTGSCSV